jgi:hypothetical protein
MYVFAYYAQAGYGGYCCHCWLARAEAKLFVVGLDVVLSREISDEAGIFLVTFSRLSNKKYNHQDYLKLRFIAT